jgi:stage III sporulation protein AH
MKNNKKKIAVLSIMTVLLVVSAVLNVWLNTKLTKRQETLTTNTNEPTVTETFKSFRSSRETTRQELIDYLDAIISSESASVSAKTAAETQKQSVCTQMENELLLERLIQARGFRDVIVTLSDKNCTVVVADDNLEAQEVAQILSVVTNETSYTANDVIVCQY